MQIDDRGLGDVVYLLTTGNGDPQFFPGMNVLVADESQPGGLWANLRRLEHDTFAAFKEKYQDAGNEILLLRTRAERETLLRELCLRMFRYGLAFAPLLQSPDPCLIQDRSMKWNQFWGAHSPFPDEKEAEMARKLLKDYQDMTEIWNDHPLSEEDEIPGE